MAIDSDQENMSAYLEEVNNELFANNNGQDDDVESLGTIFRKVEVLEKFIAKFVDGSMLKYLGKKIETGLQDLTPLIKPMVAEIKPQLQAELKDLSTEMGLRSNREMQAELNQLRSEIMTKIENQDLSNV